MDPKGLFTDNRCVNLKVKRAINGVKDNFLQRRNWLFLWTINRKLP